MAVLSSPTLFLLSAGKFSPSLQITGVRSLPWAEGLDCRDTGLSCAPALSL